VLDSRHLLGHGAGERQVVEPVETVRHHVGHRFRVPAQVQDLVGAMAGQGEHRDRADAEQREGEGDELGDVGQLHDDPVAAADAELP
jgi:hypothetical protein